MGFDNECIINIQSLAGEYFCPVCRLLVFPNEALQSQCTHLYCKPCLTYVVSTTRACPYDGYLVTEADSKPLVETNKALAETIGKIAVHCLYHRSGCSWQGTLSECTSHCSGCTFGNSPVVCNRCGIQIVHSQVQEHAQTCSGVQGQVQQGGIAQDPSATGASAVASTDQNQVAAPVAATASQPVTSQSVVATSAAGHVSNQPPNLASQTQALGQAAVQPTADQWYQQQHYQQYYQQYPGQDQYQQQYQQYYPYQQSSVPQYQQAYVQPQPQPQPQPQSQSQAQPQAQGLSQPVSHVQTPAAPQSQNHMQVHQQPQQLQPAVQPHGQVSHPPGHGQAFPQPQSYPYSQVQPHSGQPQQNMQIPPYQQPHPQMQHPQPQNQQPVQKYPVPQPQVHSQMQPNAPVQHPSQPQMQSHLPMAPNVQSQGQNTMSHAVTGHHSYPQPLPHQNMQVGAPQSNMHLNPSSGQLQGQHPVQVQNQFPQQTPMMRPNQSHAMYPNQQVALLPPSLQGQSTPPLQPQPGYTPNQQTGQTNQRPILQPVQQILPQQPFAQHQTPMPSHLRPQGPPVHSFSKHAYPQSKGNIALSQNVVGRPSIPNHAGHVPPFAHSANTIPVRPGNQNMLVGTNNQVQSRAPEPIERQGDVTEQQTDSASGKLGKNELKSEKETRLKSTEVGSKQNSEDPHSVKTLGPNANAFENGDRLNKNVGKGEASESTKVQHDSNEHSVVHGNEIQGGPPLKTETIPSESETDKLHSDDTRTPRPPSGAADPAPAVSQTNGGHGPGIDEYRGMQSGGLAQPAHPAFQLRSSTVLTSQLPHPTGPNQPLSAANSSALLRNHGAAPALHSGQALNSMDNFQPTMFKQPAGSDVQFNIPGRSFQPQPHGPPAGPYNQVREPPFHTGASNLSRSGGPQFGAPPHGDMHSGMTANFPPHAPEGFGVQDERFKSFQIPSQQNIDRREFEDDLKKFPRHPLDAEPGSKYGNYSLGPHEAGKRPVGFHDDAIKKPNSNLHSGHLGPGPGYGIHPMDGMAPRSPGSEYMDMPSRRFGPLSGGLISKSGIDDFEGRTASRFVDSVGNAFRDGRFPHPPSHLHRDEFDGFGNFRMGEPDYVVPPEELLPQPRPMASRPPIHPATEEKEDQVLNGKHNNFAYFANHNNASMEPSMSSSSVIPARPEMTMVDSCDTPVMTEMTYKASKLSETIRSTAYTECVSVSTAGKATAYTGCGTVSKAGKDAAATATINGVRETPMLNITMTSSHNCSSGSVDPIQRKLELERKGKDRVSDKSKFQSQSQSEEGKKEGKKQVRGSTSTKRSRAAEVHNLSERKRRDRINEKMKALQELIPRCNKSDKASMLDEAIEYLKSLQLQVQMMSMGCGMGPMMYPGIQQYMPSMGMRMGMGMGMGMGMSLGMEMGMNRPLMPFSNILPPSSPLPTTTTEATPYGPRFPMPPFHMPQPHVPAVPESSDNPLNSLGTLLPDQSRIPNTNFTDPYQQILTPHQVQQFMQGTNQQNVNRPGNSGGQDNPEKHRAG